VAVTTLYLVRHGQSEWNALKRLQGQSPGIPLTATGRAQARAAAAELTGCGAEALYSSDLLRAEQTAGPIARGFGTLEGLPTGRALAEAPYDLLDPDGRAPGGESAREVYDRMAAAVADHAARHRGGTVVLVSHGDALRAALAYVAGLPAEAIPWEPVENGSVRRVEVPARPRG
jgi:broad specificity phosphatase PhoE